MTDAGAAVPELLPSGNVCFGFTDIESSTVILRNIGDTAGAELLRSVQSIISDATYRHGGVVVNTEGDGCFIAFGRSADALAACTDAQHALSHAQWQVPGGVKVRMGLHIGYGVVPENGDYVALAVHQAARVSAAARGGQVLSTADVLAHYDAPTSFTELGLFSVRDFDGPVRLFSLNLPGTVPTAPRVPAAFAHHVPQYTSALVGREAELADLVDVVDATRLVSLVGSRGVGKTRLAVAAISQLSAELAAGPWFVDISAAHEARDVGDLIALAVGCPPDTELDVYLDALLDGRRGVMVLDGCEHLIREAGAAADLLLDWNPTLHIIATSVEPLGTSGETVIAVETLPLPGSADPAELVRSDGGRLFIERASRVASGFTPTESASAVKAICDQVNGLPLAIEVTAALCADTSPEVVVTALEHRGSLDEVIDYCLDQLTPAHQLGIAALTFPAQPIAIVLAVAAIGGVGIADAQPVLDELVARSLLDIAAGGSYRLLAPVRSRAARRISAGQRESVLQRLVDVCLETTSTDPVPLSRHEAVAATTAALIADASLAVAVRQRLAAQLADWWRGRLGPVRARERLEAALELGPDGPSAAALHLAIADTYESGRATEETERHIHDAARLLGELDVVDPDFVNRLRSVVAEKASRVTDEGRETQP